eukprot:12412433-Karenia_brevis.AAC.1
MEARSDIEVRNESPFNILHTAATQGHAGLFGILVTKTNCHLEATEFAGSTPPLLHHSLASFSGDLRILCNHGLFHVFPGKPASTSSESQCAPVPQASIL